MARANKVGQVPATEETIIIFKADTPLTQAEHEQLSEKVKYEAGVSGVKIVLMPFTCELGDGDGNDTAASELKSQMEALTAENAELKKQIEEFAKQSNDGEGNTPPNGDGDGKGNGDNK